MTDKYHIDAATTAKLKAAADEHIRINAERRKARVLSNLPPVRPAKVQDFLDSVADKRSDSRFDGAPITGFGSNL